MARKMKVDFTGVESFQKVSEGIHRTKIVDIQEKTSQGGDPMLQIAFEVLSGDDKGGRVFDNMVITDKALWKLKSLLAAVGMKNDGKVAIDLDALTGKVLDVNVFHEEYNGQARAKISEFIKMKTDESGDEDDEEEVDADEDVEEEPEEKPVKKAVKKPVKKPVKKAAEPEEEDDDEDADDEEEEEEEEEAPKKKATKPVKKAAPKSKHKAEEEDSDDDDDDDWDEE